MGTVGLGTMFRVGDRGIGFVGSSMGGHPCSMVKDLDRGRSGTYFHFLLRQLIGHAAFDPTLIQVLDLIRDL